jgi:hypothetical protein
MLRPGSVVVRRMVRTSSPPRLIVMVCSATYTVTTRPAWMRPRAIFCPATMTTPVLLARRWAVTGSCEGQARGQARNARGEPPLRDSFALRPAGRRAGTGR